MSRHALNAKDIASDLAILDAYTAPVMFVYDTLHDGTGEHTALITKALYKRGWQLVSMTSVNRGTQVASSVYLYCIFERTEPAAPVKRQSIADKLKSGIE